LYKLYDGLIWLKNSNKLYNNVEIVERFDRDYNIADIIIESNLIPTIPPGDVVPIVEKIVPTIIPESYNHFKGI